MQLYENEREKIEFGGENKMINEKEKWQKIVEKSRKCVEKRWPKLFNSLDFGAYIYPINYFVSFIFCTNKELEEAKESGLTNYINEYFKSCMKDNGYPVEAIKDCDFASQEQCEKDYSGNWFYYYK